MVGTGIGVAVGVGAMVGVGVGVEVGVSFGAQETTTRVSTIRQLSTNQAIPLFIRLLALSSFYWQGFVNTTGPPAKAPTCMSQVDFLIIVKSFLTF